MFTGKGVSVGIAAVLVLYVGMWLFKGFSQISGGRASGTGAIVPTLIAVLRSPAFLVAAVVVFFVVVLLRAKLLPA